MERGYQEWLGKARDEYDQQQSERGQTILGQRQKGLTLGYVTQDECPGKGDDIEHIPRELDVCLQC